MRTIEHHGWPGGVSDGLASTCAMCDRRPVVDYRVSDVHWLVVPEMHQTKVVCLDCFIGKCGGRAGWIEHLMVSTSVETLEMEPTVLWKWQKGQS